MRQFDIPVNATASGYSCDPILIRSGDIGVNKCMIFFVLCS
jgi:hypothetical protein